MALKNHKTIFYNLSYKEEYFFIITLINLYTFFILSLIIIRPKDPELIQPDILSWSKNYLDNNRVSLINNKGNIFIILDLDKLL